MSNPSSDRRYVLFGGGRQAWYLLTAYQRLQEHGFVIDTLVEPRTERARDLAEEFGIPHVLSHAEAALRETHCDGAIIATPNVTHATLAVGAMRQGLDVFLEKPLGATLADTRTIIRASRRPGVTLGVNYLYSGWATWAAEQVRAGAIGEITGAEVHFDLADAIPSMEAFWNAPDAGVVPDLFGHDLTMPFLVGLGPLIRVTDAKGSREAGVAQRGPEFLGYDTASAKLWNQDGLLVQASASWATGGPAASDIRMVLYGTGGQLEQPFPGGRSNTSGLRPVVRPEASPAYFGPPPDDYFTVAARHALNWHRAALGVEPLEFTPSDALNIEAAVDAVKRAFTAGGKAVVEA